MLMLSSELQKLQEAYKQCEQKLEEAQAEYNKKLAYNQRIIDETKKLDAMETPEVLSM